MAGEDIRDGQTIAEEKEPRYFVRPSKSQSRGDVEPYGYLLVLTLSLREFLIKIVCT
jgi:hypothetical protein